MKNYLSTADLLVIVITFVLFVAALFTKGITHDLFLEAGVFLVSVKIILMNHKNYIHSKEIIDELRVIKGKLEKN